MKTVFITVICMMIWVNVGMAQTEWEKHPGNPVLEPGPSGAWDDEAVGYSTVLFNGTDYQMWYSGYPNQRIGYATSADGIVWEKYPGNPVLEPGPNGTWDDAHVGAPAVIFNGSEYQMWYQGHDGSYVWKIGYATSADGIVWEKHPTPVLGPGPPGAWDDEYLVSPTVLFDGTYHMWYSGVEGEYIARTGYATSVDGIVWEKHPDNPVLDLGPPGAWDDKQATASAVLFNGTEYQMWYRGNNRLSEISRIGYATSANGIVWEKHPDNPVLGPGPPGAWDDWYLIEPTVLFNGTEYQMWYSGRSNNLRIGYATSIPGTTGSIEWVKYPGNPVLDVGGSGIWDDYHVAQATVLFDGTEYRMWYSGNDGLNYRIGLATSADGLTWVKYHANPVLDIGERGTWEDANVYKPIVLFNGTEYQMWYTGYDGTSWRIGYATSFDGIVWQKYHANPVLGPGASGTWDGDGVAHPAVLFDGTEYQMWYTGYDGTNDRIGYATSFDGIVWQKYTQNPVLNLGASGTWDDYFVLQPNVLFDGMEYQMWYTGSDETNWRIGYATSTDGIVWEKYPANPVLNLGESGTWDDNHVLAPAVLFDGMMYHLWYTGNNESTNRLGYATNVAPTFPNRALNLDGSDGHVKIQSSDGLTFSDQITVEAWINTANFWGAVLHKQYSTTDGNDVWFGLSPFGDIGLSWLFRINGSEKHFVFDYPFQPGTWYHIAETYDSSANVGKAYVNGVEIGSETVSGALTFGSGPWYIGVDTDGSELDNYWDGQIDEVRIWNIARTQEDIKATIKTTLQGDEPGLVAYWNFDDGTANDLSLNGNHGILMGDAVIVPLYGIWPPRLIGDVTGDGTISAYDAAKILQYTVGLIDEFPADSMVSPSAIEAQDYELSLPNLETHAGSQIQVPIAINNATGLLAGGITIKYDSTVLRAVDYASLKLLNGYYWKANTNLPGEVRFAFASAKSTTGQGNLLMVEFEVLPNTEGKTSPLIIENVNLSNSRSITKTNGEVRVIPSNFALLQNFPNPFNPDTWLPYKLASASPVSLNIYNAKGQHIRTIVLGSKQAGVYVTKGEAAYWDGRDSLGEKVASGVYFYALQAGEFTAMRKMVILK